MTTKKITIASYLVQQLNKLGVGEIFGLPGDYNFELVEAVEKSDFVNWIGCTNELNAGYAADGYARQKGCGAIITTFGVGELSAMNAIAGAMAENVPVVKIVGTPKTKDIENKMLLHHNLDMVNYKAFYNAYKNVVQDAAYLTKENAKAEIDRLLNVLIETKRPVYIAIPIDVATSEIDDVETNFIYPKSDEKSLELAANKIKTLIEKAKTPILIADTLAQRFGAKENLNKILDKTSIPSTCFLRGLGVIKTNMKNFLGSYAGKLDNKIAYDYLNSSDCILGFGTVISDLNTMNFDLKFDKSKFIEIKANYVNIQGEIIEKVLINDLAEKLAQIVDFKFDKTIEKTFKYKKTKIEKEQKLTCGYIYPRLGEFLKKGDVFVNEVGLSSFGVMEMELPDDVEIENQILWGSIGWATPCTMGLAFANKNRRTILITGDGAHQLTAQEISTMMRNNLSPIIFVINNSGYTVERILCDDPDFKYNDIASWNYSLLPKVFKGNCYVNSARTNAEFDKILLDIEQNQKGKMCYVELFTDYLDIPPLSKSIAKFPNKLAS